MKKSICTFLILLTQFCYSQVGIGTTTPDASAALDIVSDHSGVIIPRLTTTQRDDNIVSPSNGLIIMNTTEDSLQIYKTSVGTWVSFTTTEDITNATWSFGLNVKDFGALGDNNNDDTAAIQNALDIAKTQGNRVLIPQGVYKISSTLTIEDGVNLVGVGTGSTPLQTPYNGSCINFTGTADFAIKIIGHSSGLRDLVVYNSNHANNTSSGVQVLGDGEITESVRLFNILISYFIGGNGLELSSINSGGIAYLTSYNTRVRHAKTGIHIVEDATSFTNSNVFHHGAISGGGFDNGILVDGGNNNQFYGTIIEPQTSTNGHLVVNDGEIRAYEIRIEGNSQPTNDPIIHFKTGTLNSLVSGTFAGGLVVDEGNNSIEFRSGKSAFFKDSRNNLFENASFNGFSNNSLPYWEISGALTTASIEQPDLYLTHNVLKLDVSGTTTLEPAVEYIPKIGNHASYNQLTVGMFVKTTIADQVYIRTNAPNGVTISNPHPGDGQWHFISTANLVDTSTTLDTKLEINSAGTVYITAPTFSFGTQSPEIVPKPISTNGGILTGTLTYGTFNFTPSSTYITLPKEGNIFFIDGTQNIQRINHLTGDRFPKGTVITLIFEDAGLIVTDGVYVNLASAYTSAVNSNLQLLSLGDGTWMELSRNF